MSVDDRTLRALVEESQDVHSDAMRSTRRSLDEMVEAGLETRARGGEDPDEARLVAAERNRLLQGRLPVGGLVAAGLGAAVLGLTQKAAFADSATDVSMLQTAASLEVLAVATYKTALTLDFIGGSSANPVVKAFAQKTMQQHMDHEQAFNAAAQKLGGKPQTSPDPKYAAVVQQAVPGIKGPADVVDLALQLENVAAETYVANVGALQDHNAKQVTASIMGVEAQHVAVLRAVKALLAAGQPSLIALPPNAAALPGAAGSVGFPDSFYPTDQASPASEGAVK